MKNFNCTLLKPVVVLIAFTLSVYSYASDFYWINGSGNWNDASHWSQSSGGMISGSTPGANDNVIFDGNSFINESYPVVQLNNSSTVHHIFFNSNIPAQIFGGNNTLTVTGGISANHQFYISTKTIKFQGPAGVLQSIDSKNSDFDANIVFVSGKWELLNSLKTTISHSITFQQGEVISNGHTIFAETIVSNQNQFNLNLSGSVVYAVDQMDLSSSNNTGGPANFYYSGPEINNNEKGSFAASGSTFTRDQTTLCSDGNLTIDIVTLDYNGGWNVSCNDSCNGELSISASGTAGPYAYKFNTQPFSSQTFFSDLCPNNYLITVRDSSNELVPGSGIFYQCTVSEDITQPPVLQLDLIGSFTSTCPGSCDGKAFTSPQGGTPGYTVTWATSGEVTPNPVALCPGPNIAVLVDANGCSTDTTFNIATPPDITATLNITDPTCFGDCDAEVDVVPAGGNGPAYTYSWNVIPTSGQGTNPGIGFCSGSITLSIFDQDGCQQDTTFDIVDPLPLSVVSGFVADASCFGVCDGQASATPAGGVPGYTYEWFTCPQPGVTTGVTAQNPNTLCAGDYYVIVTDNNGAGCQAQSGCITIDEPTEIDATAQVYQISCFGVCDGAVDVDAVGGTPPYTYSWISLPNPPGFGVGATDSLSGLCAGIYEATVTDNNGCNSSPDTVEVIEPPQLTLTITGTDPSCYDLCDGSAIAVAGGGTPGYSYSWSPAPGVGQGTANPSSMCAGTYDLTLTDNAGCNLVDQVTLNSPPTYDISASQTNLVCAGDANGTIDVIINSGGSGAGYTYTWAPNPPVGQGTANVSGLTAGMWCVTISDNMACDTTLCFTITEPTPLSANASVISHVSCFGDCNGSAQVVVAGGVLPYTITWNPGGQNGSIASNLCQGNYTVDVVDGNGCTDNDNITINEPAQFDLSTSQVDNLCFGDCNGQACVSMNSGGSPPYNYQWDDPLLQTTPCAINLCAGNYTVTVTDQNLCDSVISFTIIEPAEIIIDTNLINSTCFGSCTGAAYITVVGGTGLYTFEWFDAGTGIPLGVNNDSISNLCPGDYYASVTDGNGCTILSDVVTITELPQIVLSLVNKTDASCGICDGTAEVSAVGGAGGFTYVWNPAPGGGQGTPIVSGLCAGAYNVVATDVAGCTQNLGININSVSLEVTTMDSTDLNCFGVCDGTATITWNSLLPPYTVVWYDNGTGIPIGQTDGPGAITTSTATALCAGTYLAVVTNAGGCVFSDTVTVHEPAEIVGIQSKTNVTCNGNCDGTASIVASGGTGALTYTWNPLPGGGQGTPNAIGLCAGNWDVTVTDANGCNVNFPYSITQPNLLQIVTETSTDISCFGLTDGTATIIHNGGTAPFSYSWIDCNSGLPIGQSTQSATNLPEGDYKVIITDANGCTATSGCLPVVEPAVMTETINIQPVGCFGYCDGMIDIEISGGTAPYFYQWQDEFLVDIAGQTNDTINNACQGIYNIEVTDFNGCSQTFGPVDLTDPTFPWNVTSSTTDVTCSGSCDGTATVTVISGNTPPYTYLWDDPLTQTTSTAINLCPGTYNCTISDASICDTTITVTILDANQIIANANISNVLCFGDCTGQIDVSPTGGNAPYTVTWSDLQVGDTAFSLCMGPITATITDNSGCFIDTIINITEPTEIIANSVFANNSSCGVCNGSATINVIGGVPGYSYNWSPAPGAGQGTNNVTGLCAGITSVDVTDANGCVLTEIFAISDVNAEVLTMDSTDVSCFGLCNGGAEVIYICGDPGCTNQWYDGGTGLPIAGETGTTISNQCAGDYYVEVTNASGCISVGLTTINSPTQIIANEVITLVTCNGANDGTITLAPSGGSGAGYSYSWNPVPPNGQGTNQALNLSVGTWCVDIQDNTGCIQSYCYDITEPNAMTITPSAQDPSCNGDCNGIISVTVAGGYGGFTYQWYDGGGLPIIGETNALISGLCAGNTTIEVTDAGGCIQTQLITLSEPSAVTGPIVGTNVLCFGDCTGTGTVNPGGGFAPYTINWYNNTTGLLIGQSGTNATNLCPEDYYAIITDANGCNFQTNVISVIEPAELTFTLNSTDASCFGVCDGDADIIMAGGTPVYTYEWLDISGTPVVGGLNSSVSNLCAGNYTIEVTDANGCTIGQQPVVINEFPQITGNVFTNDATCGVNDGSANVFANGGNPPFTYQWYDNLMAPLAGETNSTLLNIGAGTFYVDVTDASGCTETFTANVSNLNAISLTWDAVIHPSCFGSTDGSLAITASGASPPFSYTWNPGGLIAEDPTSLSAGVWTVQITDNVGCINFYDTTLVEPTEITVTSSSTASDCGLCNGGIDVVVSGGTGALTVLWNNGMSGTSLTGLCASMYEAQVTDQNGCVAIEQVDVPNNGGLTGDQLINAITCAGSCDGSVTVTGVGGTAPYTYEWLHDGSTVSNLNNLCANSYFVEITDAIGCTYSMEVEMTDPNAIDAVATITNPACGNNDGIINVATSGGVLPHTYLWNTAAITPLISNLAAGVYTLTVTDATGCTMDFIYGLNNSDAPVAQLTTSDVSCHSLCDGQSDTLSVNGGTPVYTYNWYDGSANALGITTPLITGLCAGDYMLEVTDASGCISFAITTITEPDTILLNPLFAINPTCNGLCDGQLIANPFGGTIPFTYLWDDPDAQTTITADSLCDGSYNLIITDANGCGANQSGTVIEPTSVSALVDSTIAATCLNSADGEIYITASGGTPGYTYQWVSQTLTDTSTTEDPTGLLPMSYYLTVTDTNGCTFMDTVVVDTLLIVLANAGLDTVLCNGQGTVLLGSANVGPAGVVYTWYDTTNTVLSDTSFVPVSNAAGVEYYILDVTYNGCSHQDTVAVFTAAQIVVDAGPDVEMFSNQTEIIGGSPTSNDATYHTYAWIPSTYLDDSTAANPSIVKPQASGYYFVTATDTNGCTAIDSMYLELRPDIIIPNGISPDGDGKNDTWILDFIDLYPGVDIEIHVYNRWGEPLFATDEGYQDDWGGTTKNGKRLPAGTYYYTIVVDHPDFPEPFTGPITIMW
ncbi:MAG: gliding motility-associated C-terminal domain-containing protein [Crocinitomicaceae bacterium]